MSFALYHPPLSMVRIMGFLVPAKSFYASTPTLWILLVAYERALGVCRYAIRGSLIGSLACASPFRRRNTLCCDKRNAYWPSVCTIIEFIVGRLSVPYGVLTSIGAVGAYVIV